MRRLGRLTGEKWHQERLKGTLDGEPVVRFTRGPEVYVDPSAMRKIKQDQYVMNEGIAYKLNEALKNLEWVKRGIPIVKGLPRHRSKFQGDEEQKDSILQYEQEVKDLRKIAGAKLEED